MQLLKQIWNERRSNGWLWAELLIVFVVLWYIVDWTYATARTYYEPLGYDITNTYYLELSLKNNKSDSYIPKGQKETTTGQDIVELTNRLRRLPEVEAVSISVNARPYIGSNSGIRFRLDTLVRSPLRRPVTPEFFSGVPLSKCGWTGISAFNAGYKKRKCGSQREYMARRL